MAALRCMRAIGLLCLAAGLLASASLPAGAEDAPSRMVLPNGLVLLVSPNHSSDIVAVDLMVKASVCDEPADQPGVRYLLQQALMRAAGEELQGLSETGAEIGADIGLDYVDFRSQTLSDGAERVLNAMAAVVHRADLSGVDFDRLKQDHAAYLRTTRDDAFQSTYLALRQQLYGDHPYSRSAAGTVDGTAGITWEQVLAFRERVWAPNNALLAVSGNVTPERARRLAERAFAAWPRRDLPARVVLEYHPIERSQRVVREGPTESAHVIIGFPAPSSGDRQRFAAFQVLDALLGRGMSGRIVKVLRNKMGIAYQISTFCPTLAGPGHLGVYAVVDEYAIENTKEAVVDEVNRILREPAPTDELEAAKRYVAGQYALSRQRNRQRANYLVWYETIGLGSGFETEYPALVMQVTPEALQSAAQEYLQHMVVSVCVPKGG